MGVFRGHASRLTPYALRHSPYALRRAGGAQLLKIREDRRALVRRIESARIIVGTVFALLATAYWYVQIARGEHYYALSENNRIRSVRTMAPRGYVLDRHGSILVDNQPGYTLYLYRREAKDREASVDFAAGVLKVSREQVRARV